MFKIAMVSLMLLGGGVMAVRMIESSGRVSSAMATAPVPPPVSSAPSARNVVLTKGQNGHFAVDGRVDGRRIAFLVDTGASHIALPMREANRLGIYPRADEFNVRVNTANGVTRAAMVQLGMVEVGDIIVRNVSAIVHPDEGLSVNLL